MAAIGLMMGMEGMCVLRADPAVQTTSEPPGIALTWEECVRLATRQNPDLQASREAVLNSDAVRMGAYSALYPQIAVSAGDTRGYQGASLYAPYAYSTAYSEQLSISQLIFQRLRDQGQHRPGPRPVEPRLRQFERRKGVDQLQLENGLRAIALRAKAD